MLESTFVHIPGVGPKRERALHEAGITTWGRFLDAAPGCGLPASLMQPALEWVEESTLRLREKDAVFFDRRLPSREKWRMWGEFAGDAVFLDIETTGLGCPADYVTVVGLHDNADTCSLVRGENLFLLPEKLAKYRLVVTFNGSRFDLPFLAARMGNIFDGLAHIDLRYALRALGYRGGLKAIERRVGIRRPDEVAHIDGFEAARLWWEYVRGDGSALGRLVAYNRLDVENLRPLMELAYGLLRRGAMG